MSELSEARAAVAARNALPFDRQKRNGKRQKSYEELHGALNTSKYETAYGSSSEEDSIFSGWFILFWLGN